MPTYLAVFHIVLFQPEIPPNTGNIIRLCANTGARLHLIRPLGFTLEDRQLKRAGLDYHEYATLRTYDSLEQFSGEVRPSHLFAVSTRGTTRYDSPTYTANDAVVFGPETRGLPATLLEAPIWDAILRIPMTASSRSLNLSNAAAVVVYEAWRQTAFAGAEPQ